MPFEMRQKVLFKHCDPAGIVFYPRCFEMMNDCVEAFFDQVLEHPFETLHGSGGVPTVQIETCFTAPSRHGDHLTLCLQVIHLGRTSARYKLSARADEELRFETHATLVNVDSDGRPTAWTSKIFHKLQELKEAIDAP